ncbi:hypothetical protein B0O99DRAFT_626002 [Bisporella sp. PMI_857]|nr:hypothetical protein B0O99DRAFT_626002 [Bisporella sp. PMI_857]
MTLMYLLVGLAVRIAQGLGLHLDTPVLTHKSLEWQHMRRLWWTVYELENHACLLYGAVPSITDTNCSMSLPLENLVPPGLGVPVGYLSYSTSLTVLTSQVCQLLSPRLYKQDAQVSARSFCSLLQTFKNWKDGIPSYLHYNAPSAPVHRRSVAILHLNYWTAQIYICRHFLLFYATRKAMLEENKTTFFAQMANSCINAAEEIILILRDMTASGSLSDLSFFDTNYLLKAAIIFKLANRVRENTSDIENFNCCIGLLEKMSNMEWPSEVIARMRLLSKHSQPPHDSNMAHMAMEPCNGNTRQPQGDSLDNMGLGSEENWHSFDYSNLTMNGFLPANADILAWGSLIGWDMGSFDMPQDDLV